MHFTSKNIKLVKNTFTICCRFNESVQARLNAISSVVQPGGKDTQISSASALTSKKQRRLPVVRCSHCKKIGHSKTRNKSIICPALREARSIMAITLPHDVTMHQYPSSISQSSLNRGVIGSNACTLIAMLFAHKFMHAKFNVNTNVIAISLLPIVKEAINEGNNRHDLNFDAASPNLSHEEVALHLVDLQIVKLDHMDCEMPLNENMYFNYISNLQSDEAILLIKNGKGVSILLDQENHIILFDSHMHEYNQVVKGTHIFIGVNNRESIISLINGYLEYCDTNSRSNWASFSKFKFQNVT